MVMTALCISCRTEEMVGIGIIEPMHCNGTADTTIPGLLGGFICTCECNPKNKKEDNGDNV